MIVAHRLGVEPVAMVFAARTPSEMPELAGLPERALLMSTLRGPAPFVSSSGSVTASLAHERSLERDRWSRTLGSTSLAERFVEEAT